jgi:hypothetical protein
VSASGAGGPLTLDDISESRAYERERDRLRASVIALKRIRRIAVGPLVSIVLENRTTVRFQVQEMARAEQMTTDEQIQHELDTYNALIPAPGEISATVFIELTSDEQLREWLPKLAGIEHSALVRIGGNDGDGGDGGDGGAEVVRGLLDPSHESHLTREEATASVHYVRFRLSPRQVELFLAAPSAIGFDHPEYRYQMTLTDETTASVAADWA